MRRPHPSWNVAWAPVLLAALGLAAPGQAEDFCVETDVFVGKSEQPVVRTRTLFASGVVYDFLLGGTQEVAVFDSKRGRFMLLDPKRKLQTALSTEEILQFTAAIQAAGQERESADFFQRDWSLTQDTSSGWLELSGDRIRYRAKGLAPEDSSAAGRYREFADWYARLNAMRRGNVPPFARIELNKALWQREMIPTEIERIVSSRGVPRRQHVARSRHLVHWRLSNTDRKRIQEAAELQAKLPSVPFTEYRPPTGEEAADGAE